MGNKSRGLNAGKKLKERIIRNIPKLENGFNLTILNNKMIESIKQTIDNKVNNFPMPDQDI